MRHPTLFAEFPAAPPPSTDFPTVDHSLMKSILEDWKPALPTKVFATYWYFAAARQEVFFRRVQGQAPPWTSDPILSCHRFTNAYRASDRVSQYLIRNVLYPENGSDYNEEDVFFRTILFKIFNSIPTWNLLEEHLGDIRWSTYTFERYDAVVTRAMEEKRTVFSAAYIMPSGSSTFGSPRKHRNFFRLLESMMADRLPGRIARARSLKSAYEMLRDFPLLGDFLAFQFAIDLNYSPILNFGENTFVVAGPGARNGIRKCFLHSGGLSDEEIIGRMAERQSSEFDRLGLNFQSLWGRPLQLIDCQNLFCETDKYARVAHPEFAGISGRTRIKQAYKPGKLPRSASEVPWYPRNGG